MWRPVWTPFVSLIVQHSPAERGEAANRTEDDCPVNSVKRYNPEVFL